MTEKIDKFTTHTIRQRKQDGSFKIRELAIPSEEVLYEHGRILELLYHWNIPMPHATGSLPGKTLLDNVEPHRSSSHFYMLDLQNAYAQVDIDSLVDIVCSPLTPDSYHDMLEDFIRNWATSEDLPGLPLGAPCSPYLFNLYCIPMDQKLGGFCQERGLEYTRYLDDLTFSNNQVLGKKVRRMIRDIINESSGMSINHQKSRVHSIHNGPVTITGISLQPDRRLQPSPQFFKAAHDIFEEFSVPSLFGDDITEKDAGRLHGYHGALHQLSAQETPTTRRLDALYRRALAENALLSTVELNGQIDDF